LDCEEFVVKLNAEEPEARLEKEGKLETTLLWLAKE
jgi:hypothetical protein